MGTWKKILTLILALMLALSMAACSTVQSAIGSITGKEDPSVAGNKPAGDHSQEEDPSVAGNKPAWDHTGDEAPAQGGQQGAASQSNVAWSLNGGVLTISGNGPMEDMPLQHGRTKIWWDQHDAPWYENRDSITSVVIEPGITTIASYAFQDCLNMTSVTIPDSVVTIRDYPFLHCESLTSITVPDTVTGRLQLTFVHCYNLKEATIGTGVEELSDPFVNCPNLESITILGSNTISYDNDNLMSCIDPAKHKVLVENCTI